MNLIMKRISGLIFILIMTHTAVFSQQEAQFTQYMFNNLAINPAYAGLKGSICATGLVRQQWMGFKDMEGMNVAPQTYLVSLDAPIRVLHGGAGLTIYNDKLGYEDNIGVKLAYAYRFNIADGEMSAGVQVGFLNKSIDFSKFKPLEADDLVLTSKSKESTMFIDFAAGVFYKVPNQYYVGISASQLSQSSQEIGSLEQKLKTHFYLTGGYEYVIPGLPSLEILPSVLIKTDGVSAQYDVTAMGRYNNKFWGGVNYRVQDAVSILLGMNYRNLNFGYSYDITTSALGRKGRSSGSHEIMVGYCFKIEIEKPRRSYKNTRFL